MAIIRITKEQVRKSNEAREAALSRDPELKVFEEELIKAIKQAQKEKTEEEQS